MSKFKATATVYFNDGTKEEFNELDVNNMKPTSSNVIMLEHKGELHIIPLNAVKKIHVVHN